jgi:hypothetical protein
MVARWNAEADARLREMGFGRMPMEAIVEEFGTSEGAIRVRMSTIGVRTSMKVDEAVRERIVQLSGKGWRTSRIAAHLRIAPELVEHHAVKPEKT